MMKKCEELEEEAKNKENEKTKTKKKRITYVTLCLNKFKS